MPIGKIIDPSLAASAYSNNMNIGVRKAGGQDGVSFSDFLKDKVAESVETVRESERMSARAVTEDADITEVVQAVTSAELTLQTVIALRDRMINAYQDIMRMPI